MSFDALLKNFSDECERIRNANFNKKIENSKRTKEHRRYLVNQHFFCFAQFIHMFCGCVCLVPLIYRVVHLQYDTEKIHEKSQYHSASF